MRNPAKIVVILGLVTMTILAEAAEPGPTAVELFSIVNAARTSASSEKILDPGAFARENLESTLRRIDAAATEVHAEGLDWERDALLSGLDALTYIDAVYAFELSETFQDHVALRMQVTNCGRPSVQTIGFRLEDGLWRIHSRASDSSKKATAWYHDGLQPIQTWPHVPARDRSKYFNEGKMGKAMGWDFAPQNDRCK